MGKVNKNKKSKPVAAAAAADGFAVPELPKVQKRALDTKVKEPSVGVSEVPKPKKRKEKEPSPEEPEDQLVEEEDEVEDEGVEDEMSGEEEDEEEGEDEAEDEADSDDDFGEFSNAHEMMDFDFEAFPMEEADKEGIINMLTQIFLRANFDCEGLAGDLIAQSPLGSVVGPAESCADDDANVNQVHGLLSVIDVDPSAEQKKTWVNDIVKHLQAKANKNAPKAIITQLEEMVKTPFSWLLNERMLRFPAQIAPPCFASLQQDLSDKKTQCDKILYFQKVRIADPPADPPGSAPAVSTATETKGGKKGKKNKKMGKAEKKRIQQEKLRQAETEFDNDEDALLLELPAGNAVYFDYNVQGDVEPGQFNTQEKGGKTFRPYRRVVLMDRARLNAFIEAVKHF